MSDPLDPTALADLLAKAGDDPELLGVTVDGFEERAPRQLAALRRAVDAGDDLEADRLAGELRGQADTLGAIGFGELCRQVASLLRVGARREAAARLTEAEAAWMDVSRALAEAREAGWDLTDGDDT